MGLRPKNHPGPCVYISHISGGLHPPKFTIMENTACEAMLAPAWEGCQGAEAVPVSRGTTGLGRG